MEKSPKKLDLSGIYPPIPTPFKENGDIDEEHLKSNLERWCKIGFRGIVV